MNVKNCTEIQNLQHTLITFTVVRILCIVRNLDAIYNTEGDKKLNIK